MAQTESHKAAVNRYNMKTYDQIVFRVPKGERETIAAAATAAGTSLNAFILEAVRDRMQHGAGETE